MSVVLPVTSLSSFSPESSTEPRTCTFSRSLHTFCALAIESGSAGEREKERERSVPLTQGSEVALCERSVEVWQRGLRSVEVLARPDRSKRVRREVAEGAAAPVR